MCIADKGSLKRKDSRFMTDFYRAVGDCLDIQVTSRYENVHSEANNIYIIFCPNANKALSAALLY